MKIAIVGGAVYDPAHGIDGEVRTIFIDGGKVIDGKSIDGGKLIDEEGREFTPDRTIDARGRVVMPGGVDMHCHIAGPAINRARRLLAGSLHPPATRWRAEAVAPGTAGEVPLVPPSESTGARYSLLGYTTAVEAAVAPSGARQCHLEFADTPNLNRAFLLLLANHEMILDALDRGEKELARDVVAHLLSRTGAFGVKAVNAGGVSHWKRYGRSISGLSQTLEGRKVSPGDVLAFLAEVCDHLKLPHPLHIHSSKLGTPGNVEVTLDTSRSLEGRRHHLAHLQFHAYGANEAGDFTSAAPLLIEHLNAHPEASADVGQVMFGDALTLSADQELEHFLWKVTGKPYVNIDVELESGCGMVPIEYRRRSRLHSLQWTVGLELFLLNDDPWRLALSTDHPNGASFLSYPTLIAQLMDRGAREQAMERVGLDRFEESVLRDLSREYSLYEISIITRAGPARLLGLGDKGHLGPGADADVAIYDDNSDREAMFRWPRYVLQGGEIVVEDGELRRTTPGRTLRVCPAADPRGEEHYRRWSEACGSFRPDQLGPNDAELTRSEVIPPFRPEESAQ